MTSISSLSFGGSSSSAQSPLQAMEDKINGAVKAGVLSQTDATALDKALTSIDKSMSSGGSSGSGQTADPKTKIDSLINQQVKSGTLTSDQASELQAFFASGPGGSQNSTATGTGSSATNEAGGTSGTTDSKLAALKAFLDNLRQSQSDQSGTYSVSSAGTTTANGAVLNTML